MTPFPDAETVITTADTVTPHDIRWAIDQMKAGGLVRRAGWNGKRVFIGMQLPDDQSANTQPYAYLLNSTLDGDRTYRIPWTCSQSDLLAHDWEVAV